MASLAAGGFQLIGFASSSKQVLSTILEMERDATLRNLHVDALPTEYVLGLGWDRSFDRYRICVKPMHEVRTNRELLSALTRSFDPLGFACGFDLHKNFVSINLHFTQVG